MTVSSSYPDTYELDRHSFAMLSPAKINLRLKVLGKRPDGYHELDTVFQEISLADRLEFYPSRVWQLEIRGSDLDPGETNLVTRAARLLSLEAGVPCHARIILHKQIPVGAGLGGGSSNAALTLLGLSRLWGINWGPERLHPLATQLGSDCAFFLYGGIARGRSRGEAIELFEDAIFFEVLLVIPPFGILTSDVYGWGTFPLTHDEKNAILTFCLKRAGSPLSGPGDFCNDLEQLVLSRYHELSELKQLLLGTRAETVMLSGSGSSIFALYADHSRVLRAAQSIREPYRTVISHTVSRPRLG